MTGTPAIPAPVVLSFTVPVSRPVATVFGGLCRSAAGRTSLPPSEPAKKPMPRLANALQILLWLSPLKWAVSAISSALRMSRNDGFAGASSMARVTRLSDTRDPTLSRSDQRVWAQISPSACISGTPKTLP